MQKNIKINFGKVCVLACVFWPVYPGFGGRHAYVLAKNLVELGCKVDVITTFPIDLGQKTGLFRQKLLLREEMDGIRIFRVFSFLPKGPGIQRKFLFYLSFMFASLLALPFLRKVDFVLGLDPPAPFLLLPSFIISRIFRAKYIMRVTDLWPDVFFDFNLAMSRLIGGLVVLVSRVAYRLADEVMAFTSQIKENLKKYIPKVRIFVVEMAVDTSIFHPSRDEGNLELPKDKFIVLYSGAFALTYDFQTLLKAAKILEKEDILFILLGDGDAKKEILCTIRRLNLKNVLLPIPRSKPEDVAKYINYSDVCVVPLKGEMVVSTLTRPSKIFEFWACAKPVICCAEGELEDLISESKAGITLKPENPEALSKVIKYLNGNREKALEMGLRGREFVLKRFSYEALKRNLIKMFEQLDRPKLKGRF